MLKPAGKGRYSLGFEVGVCYGEPAVRAPAEACTCPSDATNSTKFGNSHVFVFVSLYMFQTELFVF